MWKGCVLQVALEDIFPKERQRQRAERVVRIVNAAFSIKTLAVDYLPSCALACANLIEQYQLAFFEASSLLDRAAIVLSLQGLMIWQYI